jgi:hypothetical protein
LKELEESGGSRRKIAGTRLCYAPALLYWLPPSNLFRAGDSEHMGPPKRERYNAKARGSVAGAPAKKRRRVEQVDSNVELIQPTQEDEKKLKLVSSCCRDIEISVHVLQMEEMKATTETVISSKKRKRMEKYIVCPPSTFMRKY